LCLSRVVMFDDLVYVFVFLPLLHARSSTPFPFTTLFRSVDPVQFPGDNRFSHVCHLLFRIGSPHIYAEAQGLVRNMRKTEEKSHRICGRTEQKGPTPAFLAGVGSHPAKTRYRRCSAREGKIILLSVDVPPEASARPDVQG